MKRIVSLILTYFFLDKGVNCFHLSQFSQPYVTSKVDNNLVPKEYCRSKLLYMNYDDDEQEVIAGALDSKLPSSALYNTIPPYNFITDVNIDSNAVVYECDLGRDIGFDIEQGDGYAFVSKVYEDSKAYHSGISIGDKIVATSATAGDMMWSHKSADSIKSALSTRFVMCSNVKIRFERRLNDIPETIRNSLLVPYTYTIPLRRPIGLHVVEGPQGGVYVQYIKPDMGAAKSRLVEVGDRVVAMSASWGDKMWDVKSVESFVIGVTNRKDSVVSLRLLRMVSLDVFKWIFERQKENQMKKQLGRKANEVLPVPEPLVTSVVQRIRSATTIGQLRTIWTSMRQSRSQDSEGSGDTSIGEVSAYNVNLLMTTAIRLEENKFAADVFEDVFGYNFDPNPTKGFFKLAMKRDRDVPLIPLVSPNRDFKPLATHKLLTPNARVCATAAKAYGRLEEPRKAIGLIDWLEQKGGKPDIFMMTAVIHVSAKCKLAVLTEKLFWEELPARSLSPTLPTINSLMFMYAKLNRVDDVLRVYEMATKDLGMKGSEVTFGILIKALLRSSTPAMQDKALALLKSLPSQGITPNIEIFNQFLEYYADTMDYRNLKKVLGLMARLKPRAIPDRMTYSYLLRCFADAKKPKSALTIFHKMVKRGIVPSAHNYMAILKALVRLNDGITAVQVLVDMRDRQIRPDKRHFAMAMFACLTSAQSSLAETLFQQWSKTETPDATLCTLMLRALLQQDKWEPATALVTRMLEDRNYPGPSIVTLSYLLQFQIECGRFDDAKRTIIIILTTFPDLKFVTLRPVHNALSFGIGIYSRAVKTFIRESTDLMAKGERQLQNTKEVTRRQDRLQAKPSKEALTFLVEAVEMVAFTENVSLQADLYVELMQALILENCPNLAARVLTLRQENRVRIRSIDSDSVRRVEELAKRTLLTISVDSLAPNFVVELEDDVDVARNTKKRSRASSMRR